MNQLSRESRALLAAARHGELTSEADRVRIRGKLSRRLAAGLAMGTAVTASATAAEAAHSGVLAAVAAWLPGAAKVIGVVAVTGAVGVGVVQVARNSADSPKAPATAVSSSLQPRVARPAAGVAAAAPAVDAPEPPAQVSKQQQESAAVVTPAIAAKPATRSAMPPAPAAEAPVSADAPSLQGDSLGSQVSAIREARAAIRRGDPQAAMAAIDQQFPEGQASPLEPEATLARISALCRLGNAAAARRVAEQFLARFPESPLAERMRGSCAYVSVTGP
jgi:hypothetical protein